MNTRVTSTKFIKADKYSATSARVWPKEEIGDDNICGGKKTD
jgi:hypothetical protein